MQNVKIMAVLVLAIIAISGCTDVSSHPDTTDTQKSDSELCSDGSVCTIETTEPVRQVACPFGHVDEPYPGECGRYIDQDNDNPCDLSQ